MLIRMPNSEDKQYIHLTVSDPMMHTSWEDGQYTSYAINIETNSYAFSLSKSMVRRRYSEFAHLRKLLRSQHPNLKTPTLPPKALFADRFSESFIEKRRNELEKFLLKVVDVPLYLSNNSVHMFLQSNSDTQEIANIVVGGDYQESSRINSHLLLHRFLSEDYTGSDRSSDCTDVDYDSTDSVHNSYSNVHRSFSESHSHVTLGSRITVCTPTLHVPCDEESLKDGIPSVSSDENSNDSRTLDARIIPTQHLVLANSLSNLANLANSLPNSSSSLVSEPQMRKKKVSFSSEVTIAHVFTNVN